MREKLTPSEEEALRALWKSGEANVKIILSHLPAPRPPYTTLASTVRNLEKKGYVSSRMVGNTYLYTPLVDEDAYTKSSLTALVKRHFGNSYKNLVTFFAEQKKISPKELQEIIRMIEQNKK